MDNKIIVYGLGNQFNEFKEMINKHYSVVLYIDKRYEEAEKNIVSLENFDASEYCNYPIFIMSSLYYKEIRRQLVDKGVKLDNILNGVEICKELYRRESIENNDLAKAIIGLDFNPISRIFGFDRGLPIDRKCIENFLNNNRKLITGKCLEVAEDLYTIKYGTNVEKSYIMHYEEAEGCIRGDLTTGEGIVCDMVDCAIITQTLMFCKKIDVVSKNIYKMLKKGGNALITVSGISPVSLYDHERWGHYFSFYEDGVRTIFESDFGKDNVSVKIYGNLKLAMGFVYGLCSEDFQNSDFEFVDPMFPIVYGIILHKE